ncbi:MAG TPA: zinc ribbon domain-containing protein [Ktedonobacteraceae bacterium]
MTFVSLAWLLFALAVSCILAGLALTGRRVIALPPPRRIGKLTVRVNKEKSRQETALCSRCGQPLEPDARFCGACGLYLCSQPKQQKLKRSV